MTVLNRRTRVSVTKQNNVVSVKGGHYGREGNRGSGVADRNAASRYSPYASMGSRTKTGR